MLKKQPYNDHFSYVSSDTMHNITHNVHPSITQYIMRNKLAYPLIHFIHHGLIHRTTRPSRRTLYTRYPFIM
jgi:hypothetical protein